MAARVNSPSQLQSIAAAVAGAPPPPTHAVNRCHDLSLGGRRGEVRVWWVTGVVSAWAGAAHGVQLPCAPASKHHCCVGQGKGAVCRGGVCGGSKVAYLEDGPSVWSVAGPAGGMGVQGATVRGGGQIAEGLVPAGGHGSPAISRNCIGPVSRVARSRALGPSRVGGSSRPPRHALLFLLLLLSPFRAPTHFRGSLCMWD